MAIGDPGKEQFRDAQIVLRNMALVAYVGHIFTLREEFLDNDEASVRSGFDNATLNHLNMHLDNVDRWRRRITDHPEPNTAGTAKEYLDALAAASRDLSGKIADETANPTRPAGEEIQRGSGSLITLPYDLAGDDPNIPLLSQLNMRNPMMLTILGAIDKHISAATRCEDRLATSRITPYTSLMFFGNLLEIHTIINDFGGDQHKMHIAGGTRRSEEPRGPQSAPHAKGEIIAGSPVTPSP